MKEAETEEEAEEGECDEVLVTLSCPLGRMSTLREKCEAVWCRAWAEEVVREGGGHACLTEDQLPPSHSPSPLSSQHAGLHPEKVAGDRRRRRKGRSGVEEGEGERCVGRLPEAGGTE
jgi:hypothetical protein